MAFCLRRGRIEGARLARIVGTKSKGELKHRLAVRYQNFSEVSQSQYVGEITMIQVFKNLGYISDKVLLNKFPFSTNC
jgi:hypothetical protein